MSIAFVAAMALTAWPQPSVMTDKRDKPKVWEASVQYFSFKSKEPLLTFASDKLKKEAVSGLESFLTETKKDLKEEPDRALPRYYHAAPHLSVNVPGLFCCYSTLESYMGGAHGMYWYKPSNFALLNGKPKLLALQDLFLKDVDAKKACSELVIAQLKGIDRADWVQDGSMTELSKEQAANFVITPAGITFLFEPYSAGSYASGSFEIKIRFAELAGKLNTQGPLKPLLK